jgi:hypothetical protein
VWRRREMRGAHDSSLQWGRSFIYLDSGGWDELIPRESIASATPPQSRKQPPAEVADAERGSRNPGARISSWYPHRTCWPSPERHRRRRRRRSLHGNRGRRVRAEGCRHRVLRLGLGVPHRPPALLGLFLLASSASN